MPNYTFYIDSFTHCLMHKTVYNVCMPRIKTIKEFKFYFYSKEGPKPHVHVKHSSGVEVCYWLDDKITLKRSSGSPIIDSRARTLVKQNFNELLNGWNEHFNPEE